MPVDPALLAKIDAMGSASKKAAELSSKIMRIDENLKHAGTTDFTIGSHRWSEIVVAPSDAPSHNSMTIAIRQLIFAAMKLERDALSLQLIAALEIK